MVRGLTLQKNSLAHSRHSNIYSISDHGGKKISGSVESQIKYDEAEGKVDFLFPQIREVPGITRLIEISKWIQRKWDIP